MGSDIPRFAKIGDRYLNVDHIVAVYAAGKEKTTIETTVDADHPATVNLPVNEVMNAIATAERPIGLD